MLCQAGLDSVLPRHVKGERALSVLQDGGLVTYYTLMRPHVVNRLLARKETQQGKHTECQHQAPNRYITTRFRIREPYTSFSPPIIRAAS